MSGELIVVLKIVVHLLKIDDVDSRYLIADLYFYHRRPILLCSFSDI